MATKRYVLIALALAISLPATGQVEHIKNLDNVRFADQFPGADACAKILAAINDGANVVDARGFTGDQTCASPAMWRRSNGRHVLILLNGNVRLDLTDTLVIDQTVRVRGVGPTNGATFRAAPGFSSSFKNGNGASRPAVIVLGKTAPYSPGALLEDVMVDCNSSPGSIGIYSETIQEFGGIKRVHVTRYDTAAVWFERTAGGTPQNFFVDGLWATSQRVGGSVAAGVLRLDGGGNQPFHYIRDVTIDTSDFPTQPGSIGIKIASGFRGPVEGVHCEEVETCVDAANGVTLNSADTSTDHTTVLKVSDTNGMCAFNLTTGISKGSTTVKDTTRNLTLTNYLVSQYCTSPNSAFYVAGSNGPSVVGSLTLEAAAGQTGEQMKVLGRTTAPIRHIENADDNNRTVHTEYIGNVQTSDATPTAAFTHAVSGATVEVIRATVAARQTNASNRAGYHLVAVVYREGGRATIQGRVTRTHEAESNPEWNADLVVSGNDVQVQVTGASRATINWDVFAEITRSN